MQRSDLPTFAEFYTAVHGYGPFPWQNALAERLMAGEAWPEAVDVATGLGKTSLLDIALYAMAAGAVDARRRVFFVVDRRLVVDEAYEHATELAAAINNPHTAKPEHAPVLEAVASRLRSPGDGGDVVEATRMRGGTTWSWQWVQRPDRCALVVGTVDQIGSRLFMRGYGVSDRLRPIDAALVGTDSLILVDEAHLAQAMLTSIDAATADQPANRPHRPRLVQLSATVDDPDGHKRTHSTSEDDRTHPVAGPRLRAPRRMYLVQPSMTRANAAKVVPEQLVSWALALADEQAPGPVVLAVCNTVARARSVFDLLARRGVDADQRVLLTGRSRPVDRERLMDLFYERIRVGRKTRESAPLFVVATQTVEVGANIDADALVTESASMTALVQRLGRLARAADKRPEGWEARAVVVHDTSVGSDDPVYGPARQATWEFLAQQAAPVAARKGRTCSVNDLGEGVNASPEDLASLLDSATAEQRRALREETKAPPLLHTGILRTWEHTAPTPATDVPVAPFLHGIDTRDPDVVLVWREDIDPGTCLDPDSGEVSAQVAELLRAVPPSSEEQLQISVAALRRWRAHRPDEAARLDDLEGGAAETVERTGRTEYVLRYRGPDDLARITIDQVHPGDLIIVPSRFGGCDAFGWAPHSAAPVADVADAAARRGRPLIRLHPRLGAAFTDVDGASNGDLLEVRTALQEMVDLDAAPEEGESPVAEDPPEADAYARVLARVTAALERSAPGRPLARRLSTLASPGNGMKLRVRVLPMDQNPAVLPRNAEGDEERQTKAERPARLIVLSLSREFRGSDADEASTSKNATPVLLDEHQEQVARQAVEFARNVGLSPDLVHAVYLAALWHDEGKRDPRFQAMLHGTTPLALPAGHALAKSLEAPGDARARRRVLAQSGYPRGMRHEGLSTLLAAHYLDQPPYRGVDRELVLHLIASHHGHSRPLLPAVNDPAPQRIDVPGADTEVSTDQLLDWDSPARFARLSQRLGRWRLALVESVVRMADMWCSAGREVTAPAYTPPTASTAPSIPVAGMPESTVGLPALDGRDGLGFLAALGVLRLLDQHLERPVRLSFDPVMATAQITSTLPDLEAIARTLEEIAADVPEGGTLPGVRAQWPPQIGVGEDPMRVPRQTLAGAVDEAVELGGEQARAWLLAIATDLAADRKERVALTPFMAAAGGQKAATFFSKPFELVRKDPAVIRQALERWRRVDGCTGENLDHRAIHTAAYIGDGGSRPWGVPGATWLATHALPLLFLGGDGCRARSVLWHRRGRRQVMLWPVWRNELGIDAVRALLDHPALVPESVAEEDGSVGLRVSRARLSPLGVLTAGAAHRRPIPGSSSAGVLTPTGVTVV
ncbi:type I-U CRISPR-associated helicase/endonuclease Cas3 [Nocardiopsis sp. CNT312]|uniref:type I-G CRISPR-associated helicase/endonuclease Cas3g n=1 Tax=Nocardiopsis sp. CNT312 TaxID=1137268 RepID=UPI00048C1974|nr:type I-U CRISPR-associated helicase/endonuclease Cas3 [Nocardiopsis sp. CNT312]